MQSQTVLTLHLFVVEYKQTIEWYEATLFAITDSCIRVFEKKPSITRRTVEGLRVHIMHSCSTARPKRTVIDDVIHGVKEMNEDIQQNHEIRKARNT